MTEAELKKLAESAAEFLRWFKEGHWWQLPEDEANWLQEPEYLDSDLRRTFFNPDYIHNEAPHPRPPCLEGDGEAGIFFVFMKEAVTMTRYTIFINLKKLTWMELG